MNINDTKTNVYHITYFPKFKTICLYFAGCNFHCLGCIRQRCSFDIHLPSSPQPHTKNFSVGVKVFLTAVQILNVLKKEKVNKVIFMGGEPTVDPKFVFLTKELKEKLNSYNVLLTNGYILPDFSFLDEVCVGIKAETPKLHREYTGKNPEQVFKNLKILDRGDVILRTESIFIPDYIGLEETGRIAKAISRINPSIPHRIDAYIPVPDREWRRPTQKEMEKAIIIAKKYLRKVTFIKTNKRSLTSIKILA